MQIRDGGARPRQGDALPSTSVVDAWASVAGRGRACAWLNLKLGGPASGDDLAPYIESEAVNVLNSLDAAPMNNRHMC